MKRYYKSYFIWILVLAFCLTGCQKDTTSQTQGQYFQQEDKKQTADTEIEFINTGNSDCILIGNQGEYMMIDGGDNDDENMLQAYLQKKGITKLKYVVLTHPDADHCGGLDRVLESVEVEYVFIGNGSAETKTYKDFVEAAINKGLKPSVPLEDKVFSLGTGKIQFYNQTAQHKDVNDNSLVTLYTNGDFKALFTGDASQEVEESLPLAEIGKVQLLKAGHHGSRTSSSPQFIEKLSPQYVVICCGENNKYGHPHPETLETFKKLGIPVYRTDLNGTVTVKQEQQSITVHCEKESQKVSEPDSQETPVSEGQSETTVYITGTGKKYHREGCSHLKESKIAIDQAEAEREGYTPCSKCY